MKNSAFYLRTCTFVIAIFSSLSSFGQLTYKDLDNIYPLFKNVHSKDVNSAVEAIYAMMKRKYVLSEHHMEGPTATTAFNDRYIFADCLSDGINEDISVSVVGNEYQNWKLSEVRIAVYTDNLNQYIGWVTDLKNDKNLTAGQKSLLSEIYYANFGADIPTITVEVRLPEKSSLNNIILFERNRYALFYTRTFK